MKNVREAIATFCQGCAVMAPILAAALMVWLVK